MSKGTKTGKTTELAKPAAPKAAQKKSSKLKSTPAKGLEEDDESDLDLENELDQENAIEELQQKTVPEEAEADEEEVLTFHNIDSFQELLEGFESESGSESDTDTETPKSITLPTPPTNREKKLAKKAAKQASANISVPTKPGTVYLGHIPHGFFEKQMHSYFSQFGTVTRLRLSRNRKTGKSKHYGWVEFSSRDVAEVVAETMDGYLIHPQRMVCKVVESVDERVWIGANTVFKRIPWQRINKEKLEGKRTKEKWEVLAKKEDERNRKRAERIKELGIDYEVPVRGEKRKVEDAAKKLQTKKAKVEKGKDKKEKRVVSGSSKKSKAKVQE